MLPGHCLSPCQTNEFGGFGLDSCQAGASKTDLPLERPCCAPPILQGLSFSTVGLTPLSPLTPLVGGTQFGEEGRGTGGAGCPQPGDPLCSRLRKRPPKPCSVHQQDELTDSAVLAPAMRELEPSSVYQTGKATTASQRPCCTPQPGNREGQLSKDTETRVFITGQGLCSGGADVPLEEVTGMESPAQTAQARQ